MNRKLAALMILFFLAACDSLLPVTLNPTALDPSPTVSPTPLFGLPVETVKEYLARRIGATTNGAGKVFCAYVLLDSDQRPESPAIYLWTLCQEYYMVGKSLYKGSGISVPVALYLHKPGNLFEISAHKIPGNGTQYPIDVRAVFPEATWDAIFGSDVYSYNQRSQALAYQAEDDAMIYFGVNNSSESHPTYTPIR